MASTSVYLPEQAERRLEVMRGKIATRNQDPSFSKGALMSQIIQLVLREDRTGARVRSMLELPE